MPAKIVNIWNFDPKKLEINKEGSEEIGIYYISYGDDVGPFYLIIYDVCGYFECNDESKYLNLVFCTEYEDVMHLKYIEIWEEIKNSINKLAHSKYNDFNKDCKVIRFDSDDVLPLDKTVEIKSLTLVIRSVLERDGGYYPQFFLDDCLYEV